MKRLVIYAVSFILLLACSSPSTEEDFVVILITKKAPQKDGIYLNLADPNIVVQTYSGEALRYFVEFNKSERKSISYDKAYRIYKKRYKKSYYELFPGDFLEGAPNRTYNAIMIDTLKETAFTNKIGDTFRMY